MEYLRKATFCISVGQDRAKIGFLIPVQAVDTHSAPPPDKL